MSPLYTYNGQLVVNNNSLAINNDCCCDTCGCKLSSGSTLYTFHTSSSTGMNGLGGFNFCTITAAGMNARGVEANKFVASNIQFALPEIAAWLTTLGYCVTYNCSCCDYYFPESLSEEDPNWALNWPCSADGLVDETNFAQAQIDYPDIQLGECLTFRQINSLDPFDSSSPCDDDPSPCPHCCMIFYEPYATISASCCNNCGYLGPLVSFVGTVEIYMPDNIIPFLTNTKRSDLNNDGTPQLCSPAAPNTNCFCGAASIDYYDGGFTIGYTPKDIGSYPGIYYMTATARLCRNNACCIGPSGAIELDVEPGTCSYAFATETECECRDIDKTLCCILHTREVRGSLNGQYAADKIDGVFTPIEGVDQTIDSCPVSGIYEDLAPIGYGSGNYNINLNNLAFEYYKTPKEVLPGWQNVSGNYVYTGVGAPSADTVLTLGGAWIQGNSLNEYTWTPAGSLSFGPDIAVSESGPGDPWYCKWKSKEYYYEWRWVSLANTYTCGAPSGDSDYLAIASAAEPGSFYCGAGSGSCLTVTGLESTGGRTYFPLPDFAQRLLNNPTEQQCGPQWGTWQNGVCGEIDCGQQLP